MFLLLQIITFDNNSHGPHPFLWYHAKSVRTSPGCSTKTLSNKSGLIVLLHFFNQLESSQKQIFFFLGNDMRLSVKTTCCEYLTCDMRNVFVNISYFLGRRRRESISHFFVCFAFRPYEDRLRTLLLLLQLVGGQSRFYG